MLVTISGLPGSGTTTVSHLVAGALGVERVPGGEVFRQMAAEAGMTLAEFGAHAHGRPEIDRELDDRLQARAAEGGCIIESRLAGWLVTRAGLPAVRVWVDCDIQVRAARVAARDGRTPAQARVDNEQRSDLERARYRSVYGIDLDDRSAYDLVLDSSATPPEDLAATIVARARACFP